MTFYDLFKDDDGFDAGTIAGKGLTNAIFTFYYMGRDIAKKNKKPEEEVEEEAELEDNEMGTRDQGSNIIQRRQETRVVT